MDKHVLSLLQLLVSVVCGDQHWSSLGNNDHQGGTVSLSMQVSASAIETAWSTFPTLSTVGWPHASLHASLQQQIPKCNKTRMMETLPECRRRFEVMMQTLDPSQWCNITEFIMYYNDFSQCTENSSLSVGCFWPNSLVEAFITGIHKHFFSNCTSDEEKWEDPPDEILTTLILIPVFLTAAMISLVVWCSKRADIFG
ncbi:receptor activity-modifying protein 3 [Bombina bombina]|uniref:receptor activity-modifying protein 3 n=1 Tax=Bombina bombina TaxID=8345 RepID=UPI00235A851C|nr:receptor activity-modifying protein 3 [Bombina bombina]